MSFGLLFQSRKLCSQKQCCVHLTAAEVLKKISEALDDVDVFLAIFTGVADEDFWPGTEPFHRETCGIC